NDPCGSFNASEGFEGDLAEIIMYDAFPSADDQLKVQSYLALKYGVTLDQSAVTEGINYVDSAGNIVWAKDVSDTFEHNIVGIGQDDFSALDQVNSKSIEPDAILTLSGATAQDHGDFLIA